MRSTNYAYSIAFEYFYRNGNEPKECHELSKKAVERYESGESFHKAMRSLVKPEKKKNSVEL